MRGLYNPIHPAHSFINKWKPSDTKRIKDRSRLGDSDIPDSSSSANNFVPKQLQHRLNPVEIVELISAYRAGILVKELAKCYQIDRRTVSAILKRQGVKKALSADLLIVLTERSVGYFENCLDAET